MIYSYRFVVSPKDVRDADEAYVTSKSGMRRTYRVAMALFGAMWLGGGITSYLQSGAKWRIILGSVLGIPTLYWFGLHPFLRRRQLGRRAGGGVAWEFDATQAGVGMRSGNSPLIQHQWNDLHAVYVNGKGILCQFSRDTSVWIPNRVFGGRKEKAEFARFLDSRKKQRTQAAGG